MILVIIVTRTTRCRHGRRGCVRGALCTTGVLMSLASAAFAQDVEPRRWSHLPTGTNFLSATAVYTDGDLAFDPVLLIEDAELEVYTALASYLRTFGLFGRTARIDFRVPYQSGRWQGLVDSVYTTVERDGLADSWARLSINLFGAPALKGKAFQEYHASRRVTTIVGTAVSLGVPIGEYMEDKLINLGDNRFVIRPQAGVVHTRGPASYEVTGSVFFYTDNNEFWNGNTREQDPLYELEGHVVYTIRRGLWTSLGAAYAQGGQSTVNGTPKDDRREILLASAGLGLSITRTSRIGVVVGIVRAQTSVGADTNNAGLSYSITF